LAQRGGRGQGPAREAGKPFCINPADIEQVEILKGPAAVAAYAKREIAIMISCSGRVKCSGK